MQRRLILVSLCSVSLAALSIVLPAQQPNPNKLVGTWKLIIGKYNGQAADLGKEAAIKHVTGTHFTWLRYDTDTKKISNAAGGPYTMKGDTYSETPIEAAHGHQWPMRDGASPSSMTTKKTRHFPSRQASTTANHQYDPQVPQACKVEGIWSGRAWLAATHIHGSVGARSQLRLPRIVRGCTAKC